MGLTMTSLRIGAPERERFLATALSQVRTPAGEDWVGRISQRTPAIWELLLSGPARPSLPAGWEIVAASPERVQLRLLLAPRDRRADSVCRIVRAMIWDGIRFADNGIAEHDPQLAQNFEDAVWDALAQGPHARIDVRLGVWADHLDDPRFVCGLEIQDQRDPSRVWSCVVQNAQELSAALRAAVPRGPEANEPAVAHPSSPQPGGTHAVVPGRSGQWTETLATPRVKDEDVESIWWQLESQ